MVLTCFNQRFLVENRSFGRWPHGQGSSDTQIDGYHRPTVCRTWPLAPGDHQGGEILAAAQLLAPWPCVTTGCHLPSQLQLSFSITGLFQKCGVYHGSDVLVVLVWGMPVL